MSTRVSGLSDVDLATNASLWALAFLEMAATVRDGDPDFRLVAEFMGEVASRLSGHQEVRERLKLLLAKAQPVPRAEGDGTAGVLICLDDREWEYVRGQAKTAPTWRCGQCGASGGEDDLTGFARCGRCGHELDEEEFLDAKGTS